MSAAIIGAGAAIVGAGASIYSSSKAGKGGGGGGGPIALNKGNPTDLFWGGSNVTSNEYNNVQRYNESGDLKGFREGFSLVGADARGSYNQSRNPNSMDSQMMRQGQAGYQQAAGLFGQDPSSNIQWNNGMRNWRDQARRDDVYQQSEAGFNGPGANSQMNQGMFAQAQGMMAQDSSQLEAQHLADLRQQAQPGEDRQANAMAQKMFSMGQTQGSGGALMAGEVMDSQNRADLGRQLAAKQLGMESRTANMRDAGMMQGMGFAGQGVDVQNRQMEGQIMQGAMTGSQSASDNQFRNDMAWDATKNTRAMDRMNANQGMFGFGQTNRDNAIKRMGVGLQATQGMDKAGLDALSARDAIISNSNSYGSGGGGGGTDFGMGLLSGAANGIANNPQMIQKGYDTVTGWFGGGGGSTGGTNYAGVGTGFDMAGSGVG